MSRFPRQAPQQPIVVIGIDPGVSGGWAVLDAFTGRALHTWKMPDTDADLVLLATTIRASYIVRRVFVERVHSLPGMGHSGAFTFGGNFRALHVAAAFMKWPLQLVTPIKWQTYHVCRTKGDKNISKARAQQLFPDLTITHSIADALLIAEYGRRHLAGSSGVAQDPERRNDWRLLGVERSKGSVRRGPVRRFSGLRPITWPTVKRKGD